MLAAFAAYPVLVAFAMFAALAVLTLGLTGPAVAGMVVAGMAIVGALLTAFGLGTGARARPNTSIGAG